MAALLKQEVVVLGLAAAGSWLAPSKDVRVDGEPLGGALRQALS